MSNKNFIISALTVFVQYYDYHLFGFLAADIADHFFSPDTAATQILHTYFIMTLAVIAKPLGAILLGKIGDRSGRSNSFKISLICTAIASIILSLTPSYESIGLISAFILLLCRMTICTFTSSGSDGVRIYIFEHIDRSRRSFGIAITNLFILAGSFFASTVAWIFTLNYFPPYFWRFAFLLGGILGLIVLLVMRIYNFSDAKPVKETEGFEFFQNRPLIKILGSNYKLFILCTILAGSIGSTNQFLLIFFGTYNFEILGIVERSLMSQYISIAIALYMIFGLIAGFLADKFGPYLVFNIAVIVILILSAILCIEINNLIFDSGIFFILISFMPLVTMPAASIFTRSIPKAVRYRFFSLSHAIGSVIISAPTAFISTYIYVETNIPWLPLLYFIATIILIFITTFYLNKQKFTE